MSTATQQKNSQYFIELENEHGAHNYHPLPVVLDKGEGVYVWDVEGKRYFDFLSAYSAVNQGHSHPKIVDALIEQAQKLTLTSRAFYNSKLGEYEKKITKLFGFDKVLPMNSGAEAVETALKIARKWSYEVKGIKGNSAKIIVCENNFHGRTTTIVSFSNDPDAHNNYGPFTPGFTKIPYNDLAALETVLKEDAENIAAFLVEPIQGEAGVYVPDEGFLKGASELCKKHNVLFIADEVQTGFGRTGKLFAMAHHESEVDIITYAKSLAGGMPLSGVVGRAEVMDAPAPGGLGGTYAGNALSIASAHAVLDIIEEENLCERANQLGDRLKAMLTEIKPQIPHISDVRGPGAMNAVEFTDPKTAQPDAEFTQKVRAAALKRGLLLLTCGTYGNVIRFLYPLTIQNEVFEEGLSILKDALLEAVQ